MNKKKRWKLIGMIILAILLFYGILLVFGSNIAGLLYQTLFYGKYNTMFISELVILLFALIMLLLGKRLSILKPCGKSIIYGIKRGMPIFVVSLISLFSSLTGILGENLNIPNLISLIILAITIGMAEEFFFRGFIQGEIVDAYGKSRKQVIISVVVSGVIFGLVHITNALSGQDIITTLMQVIQASSLGILLGSIYFITKNIWSVVFLHAFYDFAIMLSEVNSYKDCINSTDISMIMLIFTLVVSLIYVVIYLVGAYLNLQKRHVNECIGEEVTDEIIVKDGENATKAKKLVVVVIVLLFLASPLIPADEVENFQICYTYENVDINGEINFALDNEFVLNDVKLYVDDYNLVMESIDGENKTVIETLENDIYDIYVYEIDSNYHILLNANEILYYGVVNNDSVAVTSEFTSILINSFQKYDVPEIMDIGKLESNDGVYPLIKSYVSDYFIIKDNVVMVINQ